MTFYYYEKYHLHENKIYEKNIKIKYMKTATLINEIITSLERLIISIRTLYAHIKDSFKKEKNITI